MEVKINEISLIGNEIVMLAKVIASIDDIERWKERYSGKTLDEVIVEKIAIGVTQEYLKVHKADMVKGINIEEVMNGVKLKIIEGFSLNKHKWFERKENEG